MKKITMYGKMAVFFMVVILSIPIIQIIYALNDPNEITVIGQCKDSRGSNIIGSECEVKQLTLKGEEIRNIILITGIIIMVVSLIGFSYSLKLYVDEILDSVED